MRKNGTINGKKLEPKMEEKGMDRGRTGTLGKKLNYKSDAKCTLQPNRKDVEARMQRDSNPVFFQVFPLRV